MNEENTVNPESGDGNSVQDSSSDSVQEVETVIYTDQLDKVIETQQMSFGVTLVLVGVVLVLLIISVLDRYL